MKKKKRLADLMEEDLMETTQKRIDELNAELKLLDEQCGKFFTPISIRENRRSTGFRPPGVCRRCKYPHQVGSPT